MSDKLTHIKVESAALDEHAGRVVLRGVIAQESLGHLKVDDYQREELSHKQRASIFQALEKGEPLPDLELGMRSEKFSAPTPNNVVLKDVVYIIDGFQRRNTVLEYLAMHPDATARVGAKVYLGTTMEWERERFHVLNAQRTRVSANILLRNRRDQSPAVQMLWNLTKNERTFVLNDRVCWTQQMARGELITVITFGRAVNYLHSHKGPNNAKNTEIMARSLDKTFQAVGLQAARENIRTFFGLVDECWGIRRVHYRNRAAYLKGSFLYVLAKLLSDHPAFWKGPQEKHLFIEAALRRKIALFPINDPEVQRLAGANGKAQEILYGLLRDHINSGKRTKRITSRFGDAIYMQPIEEDPVEEEVDKAA